MPLPPGCPAWEYQNIPGHDGVLRAQTAAVLASLRGTLDAKGSAKDTRPIHLSLFRNLVPAGFDYYAGHYRGEAYACLRPYEVQVPADPRVGYPPAEVAFAMAEHASLLEEGFTALDLAAQIPKAQVSDADKLLYAVAFTCRAFVQFLTVHPYANGNGHAARFCVWAILGRYGYWPRRWPVEPRPPDPPYSDLIKRYRDGDREPLEAFVLKCIVG